MLKKLVLLISIIGISGPSQVFAQPADLPYATELLRESALALGWQALPGQIGSIEAHAHVTVGDRAYDTIVKGAVTDSGFGDTTFILAREDGTVTYGETAGTIWYEGKTGTRRELMPEMASYVRGHQFHRRALFPQLELAKIDAQVKEADFDGHRAFKISGTTAAGAALAYFFDQRSKILLGFHLEVQEPDGGHPMDFFLRDWRKSGDQSLFWRVEVLDRGELYTYRFSKILLLP